LTFWAELSQFGEKRNVQSAKRLESSEEDHELQSVSFGEEREND
jgi:hypothetical protein